MFRRLFACAVLIVLSLLAVQGSLQVGADDVSLTAFLLVLAVALLLCVVTIATLAFTRSPSRN